MSDPGRRNLPRRGGLLAAFTWSYLVFTVINAKADAHASCESESALCEAPSAEGLGLVQAKSRHGKVNLSNHSDAEDDLDIDVLDREPQDTGTTLLSIPANESASGTEKWVVAKAILNEDIDEDRKTAMTAKNSTPHVVSTLAETTNLSQVRNPDLALAQSNSDDAANSGFRNKVTHIVQILQQGTTYERTASWALRKLQGAPAGVMIMLMIIFVFVAMIAFLMLVQPEKDDRVEHQMMQTQAPGGPNLGKKPAIMTNSPKIQSKGISHESGMPIPTTPHLPHTSISGGLEVVFCPDLIVPQGCECILIIPVRPINDDPPFEVTDMNGNVVLGVSERLTTLHSSHRMAANRMQDDAPSMRRLIIATAQGDILAQCCAARPSKPPGERGSAEFHLLRASGEYFATLTRNGSPQDQYALQTLNGKRLHFWGSFESQYHAVNITDQEGKLVATTENCTVTFDGTAEYYRLRVAPLTDVGLVLCSLLCIEHLGEGQS